MEAQTVTPDMPVAEAARVIMANELATVKQYLPQLREDASVTAVHETRKAIRRTFTSFKLFSPYFEQVTIHHYRRGLKRIMKYLGHSRDTAVFRIKLDVYNETAHPPLTELANYWQGRQEHIDADLQKFLSKRRQRKFLADYASFVNTPERGVVPPPHSMGPLLIGPIAPVLLYQRVAAVRSFGPYLANAQVKQLHQLRIQFKELRYSLRFFVPLMGEASEPVFAGLKEIQDHLGDLNDASVALAMLQDVPGPKREVVTYRGFQESELDRLANSFAPLWQNFERPAWRQHLATAVAAI